MLENPVYQVLTDLLSRKEHEEQGTDPSKLAAKFKLTVTEAAARKGVSEDAIRKAIRERRLPAWVRDGAYYLESKTLDAVKLGGKGPILKNVGALTFRVGYDKKSKASFRLFVDPGGHQPQGAPKEPVNQSQTIHAGVVEKWRRAFVLSGVDDSLRFFELVPSTEEDPESLQVHGLKVEGRFSIINKINNAAQARKAWEAAIS